MSKKSKKNMRKRADKAIARMAELREAAEIITPYNDYSLIQKANSVSRTASDIDGLIIVAQQLDSADNDIKTGFRPNVALHFLLPAMRSLSMSARDEAEEVALMVSESREPASNAIKAQVKAEFPDVFPSKPEPEPAKP